MPLRKKSNNLREARRNKGFSGYDLQIRSGIRAQRIYHAERGLVNLSFAERHVLAKILEAPENEIFPEKKGRLDKITNFDILKSDPAISHIKESFKEGDLVGLAKKGFQPVLVFLVSGKTYEEVYQKSLDYQKKLQVKLK